MLKIFRCCKIRLVIFLKIEYFLSSMMEKIDFARLESILLELEERIAKRELLTEEKK